VAPRGKIKYTLDGSEARNGTDYTAPIPIGDKEALILVFAEEQGVEAKATFRFPARDQKGIQIEPGKPGKLVSTGPGRKLDSRQKTFEGLKLAQDVKATFEGISLTVGQGNQVVGINIGDIEAEGSFLEALLTQVLVKFSPEVPIVMTFKRAKFQSGHDLEKFAEKMGIELKVGDVEQ
jgi:hypothetical protein